MKGWGKHDQPVDRALRDVERRLAQVRRELRQTAEPPSANHAPNVRSAPAARGGEGLTTFVKQLLRPSAAQTAVSYRARRDLFDVADKTIEQLESDGMSFAAPAKAPDLFAPATHTGAATAANEPLASGRLAAGGTKLMQYLSAGSLRGYRPIKRVQRQERNRFFTWIGLAAAAVWLIWVVVR